jgi:hypothetical protein
MRVRQVRAAADTEHVADDDRAPRHGALMDRAHRLHRKPHGAGGFRLQTHRKAEAVDEMHDRQVEGLAGVDELRDLARGGGIPRAALMQGIAGEDADRPAVEPGKSGDDGAAKTARDLEE